MGQGPYFTSTRVCRAEHADAGGDSGAFVGGKCLRGAMHRTSPSHTSKVGDKQGCQFEGHWQKWETCETFPRRGQLQAMTRFAGQMPAAVPAAVDCLVNIKG
jgi:hypothetical protein